MIFAAGYGERLRPLTLSVPKALVPVNHKPMLQWAIEYLTRYGVDEIWINTHYLADKIEDFIQRQNYPIPIHLSYEKEILGTGGGLFLLRENWDEDFLVINADILCDADLSGLMTHHRENASMVSLMVNHRKKDSMLVVDEKNCLKGLSSGYRDSMPENYRQVNFCGIHLISPKLFSFGDQNPEFSIIMEYLKLLGQGLEVSVFDIKDAYWEDIGTLETLKKAEENFKGFTPRHTR